MRAVANIEVVHPTVAGLKQRHPVATCRQSWYNRKTRYLHYMGGCDDTARNHVHIGVVDGVMRIDARRRTGSAIHPIDFSWNASFAYPDIMHNSAAGSLHGAFSVLSKILRRWKRLMLR
jgi:hypothetical protein